MKKLLSLVLSLILILTSSTLTLAKIPEKELRTQSGEILKNLGILQGDKSGNLMLDQNLKRQDMVILMSRLCNEEANAKKHPINHNFKDVKSTHYGPFISWAKDKGLIVGIDQDKFGFNSQTTVQQFQVVLLKVLDYGEEAKDWNNVPSFSKAIGIMDGLNVSPMQYADRGTIAVMTLNALKLTVKGSSLTLAQKLNRIVPEFFKVNSTVTINKNTLKLEGTAIGTSTLKVGLRLISDDENTKEKIIDINLDDGGKFTTEISNLQKGEYEYRFISNNKSTEPKSITIEAIPLIPLDSPEI